MRTNVVIDDKLMKEAMRFSRIKTKKKVIEEAIREFIVNRKRLDLGPLRGKIDFWEDYDYKAMRR